MKVDVVREAIIGIIGNGNNPPFVNVLEWFFSILVRSCPNLNVGVGNHSKTSALALVTSFLCTV